MARTEHNGKFSILSLGDDFGEVTVKVNGVSVDIGADGNVVVQRQGGLANIDEKAVRNSSPLTVSESGRRLPNMQWLKAIRAKPHGYRP